MKKITMITIALIAILITVASTNEEQATVRNVEATETAATTSVGITLDEEVTPVKTEMSPDYTKAKTKSITEGTTYSIVSEIEPKPETKQTVIDTEQIAVTTAPTEETMQPAATTSVETTTVATTKPIETTTNLTTSESPTTDAPESEDDTPEYKPSIGGDNPFDDPNDITEIDDHPVEDYISENENRPGEGLHF